MMMFTWSLTLTAFIMIFIDVDGWSSEEMPHAVLGTITTLICVLHPILASFRPAIDSPKRKYFNMGHAFGGGVAQILSCKSIDIVCNVSGSANPVHLSSVHHIPGREHAQSGTTPVAFYCPGSVCNLPPTGPWIIHGKSEKICYICHLP